MQEEGRAYNRAYYQAHKEQIKERKRAYYQAHKEELRAYRDITKSKRYKLMRELGLIKTSSD